MSLSVSGSNNNSQPLQALLATAAVAGHDRRAMRPAGAIARRAQQQGERHASSATSGASAATGRHRRGISFPQFGPQILQALLALQNGGASSSASSLLSSADGSSGTDGTQQSQPDEGHHHHHHMGGGEGAWRRCRRYSQRTDGGRQRRHQPEQRQQQRLVDHDHRLHRRFVRVADLGPVVELVVLHFRHFVDRRCEQRRRQQSPRTIDPDAGAIVQHLVDADDRDGLTASESTRICRSFGPCGPASPAHT